MDYGPVPNKMDMCVLERERERGIESEEEGGRVCVCVCEDLMVKKGRQCRNIELLKLMWPRCNARAFF